MASLARLAFLLGLLLVGPALAGTAPAPEKEKKKDEGSTLSDAAKETAQVPDQQRVLHADEKKSCDGGSSLDLWLSGSGSGGSYDESPDQGGHDLLRMLRVGAVVETGSLSSPDFAPATLYGLSVGISDHRRTSLDLAFLAGPTAFLPGSDLAARFREPGELVLDGSLRYSLTSPHAAVGIAPLVGFRAGWLSWRYRNGIWVERGGDVREVSDDGIDHYSPYLGLAVTLLRTRHVELGAAGLTGWRFYGSHSDSGLKNDLFGEDRFSEVRLEARFGL